MSTVRTSRKRTFLSEGKKNFSSTHHYIKYVLYGHLFALRILYYTHPVTLAMLPMYHTKFSAVNE
jgi:hypothetical protein